MARRALAVFGLAVGGAQAGHLVAYQLRFGSAASQVQSSGAHAYFPALVKTSLGVIALLLLAGLVLIATARLLARGRAVRSAAPSYLNLLAALFTVQLACFAVQEIVESLAAGVPGQSAANLLLWGMIGQLPVALAGAAALRWLWTRIETAAAELAALVRPSVPGITSVPVLVPIFVHAERALVLVHSARSPHVKRGPPLSSSRAAV